MHFQLKPDIYIENENKNTYVYFMIVIQNEQSLFEKNYKYQIIFIFKWAELRGWDCVEHFLLLFLNSGVYKCLISIWLST